MKHEVIEPDRTEEIEAAMNAALRKAAHDAPLARLGMRHTGERFIEFHTDAWAKASREWIAAIARAEGKGA